MSRRTDLFRSELLQLKCHEWHLHPCLPFCAVNTLRSAYSVVVGILLKSVVKCGGGENRRLGLIDKPGHFSGRPTLFGKQLQLGHFLHASLKLLSVQLIF